MKELQRSGRRWLVVQAIWSVFFITITWCVGWGARLHAEQVSNTAPLASSSAEPLPDSPDAVRYPDAKPLPRNPNAPEVEIEADYKKWEHAHFTLDGHVHLTYENRTVNADHAEFDENTGDATLEGHVLITGGENDERISASHATMNLHTATGKFYDVSGSVGLRPVAPGRAEMVYANGNPFRFTGRMVEKTGPQRYDVYDGTVTSCQLPRPDWVLSAAKFTVDEEKARATNSVFHLFNLPLLYLPYVTHPRKAEGRQSGFLIPVIGDSSSKGLTLGEQYYWAINRSTDLTVGTIYYSARGWSQSARFQYKGLGENFVRAHYSQLQDRGYTPKGGNYTNQSGIDLTFSGRRDLATDDGHDASGSPPATQTRGVADVEYLSSFVYREAFTDNFNQAVSSDIVSLIYGIHEWNGYAASVEADRYQGEKRVAQYNGAGVFQPEQQVHIFHVPTLQLDSAERHLGRTPLEWTIDSALSGLKRVQPNFTSSGIIERFDVRPELALPFGGGGWRFRPSVAVRETVYSRSRMPGATGPGNGPVESTNPVNRSSTELEFDVRPPMIERTFTSGAINRLLRHDVKHTVEPELTYRYVTGINNFASILRFDARDVASNTNELQYFLTQRLFLRPSGGPCHTVSSTAANANEILGPTDSEARDIAEGGDVASAPSESSEAGKVCGTREWISWQIGQKYFFDPTFGNAITNGPRNVLDSSLSLTGISFITRARSYSPLISRLRIRTSEKTDVEWDFDYDFCGNAPATPNAPPPPPGYCNHTFAANNVFVDVHQGRAFGGISYAWLNAPAVSYVDGVRSPFAQFDQMRILLGWGNPARSGFSAAANTGLDLKLGTVQYGALQTSYNWNCCGFSVEYRKYELGTARNENAYRFNFTLANIGTAGNLRRNQQVF